MRRSLITTALVLAAGALYFVGCTDSTRVPTEPPSFKKGGIPAPQARINALIEDAFSSDADREDAQKQMARIKNALARGDTERGQALTQTLIEFVDANANDENAAELTAELWVFSGIKDGAGVIGSAGGNVVSNDEQAAVSIPAGALSDNVLISFFKKEQPCFPDEWIREEEQFDDCYTFEPGNQVFVLDVRFEVCLDPTIDTDDYNDARLHGFDAPGPPPPEELVEEQHFLIDCVLPLASTGSSGIERFARAGLKRLMSFFSPEPLLAANAFAARRLGGTRGSFTDIGWALPQGPVVLQSTELCSEYPDDDPIATFDDEYLETAVRAAALPEVSPEDPLTCSLISGLTYLPASNAGIESLVGIQNLTGLMTLYLHGNSIIDISELSGLTSLTVLSLDGNSIPDISALSALTSLTYLSLASSSIIDISELSGLWNLTHLVLASNSIIDISALSGLTNLTSLNLAHNQIGDISGLSGLTNLTFLVLHNNSISGISALSELTSLTLLNLMNNPGLSNIRPLLDNGGLGTGDRVYLANTSVSCADLAALQVKGVTVGSDADCPVIIDGVLQPGEWNDATEFGLITVGLPGETTTTATVYVRNGENDLQIAVKYDENISGHGTILAVRWDTNGDDSWGNTAGEDGYVVRQNVGGTIDTFDEFVKCDLGCQGQRDTGIGNGGTNNVVAASTNTTTESGSETIIEVSHPINSTDPRDVVLTQGQEFGLLIFTNIGSIGNLIHTDLVPASGPPFFLLFTIQ